MFEEATIANTMMVILAIIVLISVELQLHFGFIVFETASLTIWVATRNFIKSAIDANSNEESQFLQENRNKNLRQLQTNLNELIKLANAVNCACK